MPSRSQSSSNHRGRAGLGRAARLAARASTEEQINPCPPGQRGGAYRPLTDADIRAIYATALRLLEELGMGEVPETLQRRCLEQGATLSDTGRLCFSKAFIEDIIDGAAKSLVLYGRDSAHDIEVGDDRVYFGTGGAAVQTLDLDTSTYRPSTLVDLYDFTRLVDTLTNVSWFTRCCVATDVPDNLDLDINTAYTLLTGTTKPVGTSFFLSEHVDPIIDMFDMALGGEGKFKQRPFCKAHVSPIISPMRYGEDAVDVALAAIQRGMPINCITGAQSGATAPATLAGFLTQTLAETLAALVMVNVFAKGYPMIFSNWPFVVDLRTGSFTGGSGEVGVMNAASAQLINHLGLPSGVASSMTDSKALDAQMGAEKAYTALAAGLAGSNLIYESSGMMASLLGVSFEAFVLDDEMLSNVNRMLRGIEVNEETLGFDAICYTVMGEGHFLGGDHTMAAMQRDYFYPEIADRADPRTWQESGAMESKSRARIKAQQILKTHYPEYLSPSIDKAIRERYQILLSPDAMKPK